MRNKTKAIIERDLKTATVQVCAQRYAVNPDTYKTMSAWFSVQATFTIDPNKKFRNFTLIKLTRFRKFTWEENGRVITATMLTDGKQTVRIAPTDQNNINGVDIELTEAKRITLKEARELITNGAYVCELDGNDRLKPVSVANF